MCPGEIADEGENLDHDFLMFYQEKTCGELLSMKAIKLPKNLSL